MKRCLAMLCFVVACGDRTVGDERPADDEAPLPRDVPSDPAGDSSTACVEGLIECDGGCVDVSSSDEHCGACRNECRHAEVWGSCEDGQCPSAKTCAAREQGFATCDELCASFGQSCDPGPWDGRGCGVPYYNLFYSSPYRDAMEYCDGLDGWSTLLPGTCSTPFDWSVLGGRWNRPAEAVACCCTQDPT